MLYEHGAVTTSFSADRLALVHSRDKPQAIPASCGLDELWGVTSKQSQMLLCLFVNEDGRFMRGSAPTASGITPKIHNMMAPGNQTGQQVF
jgi:hypothetical protein